ncbi:hypothetical protein [Metabacillus halosaccharovorans]|uniref:hypothetical protein n=1 Tax=Metabacillus halosaccharovorans TaxID=930124 RepID=UPI001C1F3133|nr:hypothetical protein [Metabacillus halosaccharovorans]
MHLKWLTLRSNFADQALDVYRTSKTFSNLELAEMGIYGLVSANGFSEYLTGKDMFGNKLTVEQQQNSLAQALGLLAVGGGAYYVNRLQDGSRVLNDVPVENTEKIIEITQTDREKLSKWAYPPKEEKYIKYKEVYDNPKYYDQETGNINWPPNDGFDGEAIPTVLKKGMLNDRFGAPGDGFFSPEGISYEQRALALHR